MVKTKACDHAMPSMEKYEPPTIIRTTKAQAAQVSVGDKINITVTGEVVGIRKHFDGDAYEVELKKSKVSGISGNAADKALKDMGSI